VILEIFGVKNAHLFAVRTPFRTAAMSLAAFLALGFASIVGSVKIVDMDQGAEFTKCISNTDLETKTLEDDITLIDRVGDCCPAGSVPGVKFFSQYSGAQIVCGMKDDGTVAVSTGSSNGAKTCTYNKCYVMKQHIPCKDGTKQRLNGCCGGKPQTNFDGQCKFYDKSFKNAHSETVNYCTTYDKDYGSKGWGGGKSFGGGKGWGGDFGGKGKGKRKTNPETTAWIGGLPENEASTERNKELLEHMKQAGDAKYVRIGKSGTGSVGYTSAEEVQTAIATLNGSIFQGAVIEVDVWTKKED